VALLAELDNVSHTLGGKELLRGVRLAVNDGDRLGLIGHNGSGKSTLLSLLAIQAEPDEGEIRFRRGTEVAAVEQFLPDDLADAAAVEAVGGETWAAEAMLSKLGFSQATLGYRVGDLSGGQQNRLMFARAAIREPDLLLLDEPTNHLDLATIVVFERYLKTLNCAYLLVSHDRAFLDAVTDTSLFLRDAHLRKFSGAYSEAKTALDQTDAAAGLARASEEKKIDALKTSAKRLATWQAIHGNEKLARRAKNMERRIERLQEKKTFVSKGSPLDLSVDLGATRAKEVVRVTDFDVSVAERVLFHVDEFLIRPGERIALLGHNGVGKSTFIRCLVDATKNEQAGIKVSPQTRLGYYDQELEEVQSKRTMAEFVRDRVTASSTDVRNRLIAAGFPFADHDKPVAVLSGGERARVLFVVLSLDRPNFLILDEPTNHIDIEGKEQLEAELTASDAAILITSHDRRFIDEVAERFFWVADGALVEIHEPDEFYYSTPPSAGDEATNSASTDEPTDVLERIVELEAKLEADKARKAKFQKPKLQDARQRELDALYKEIQ
jgi:ATPase subunit of ABC transporter with duplicated ATPase domains